MKLGIIPMWTVDVQSGDGALVVENNSENLWVMTRVQGWVCGESEISPEGTTKWQELRQQFLKHLAIFDEIFSCSVTGGCSVRVRIVKHRDHVWLNAHASGVTTRLRIFQNLTHTALAVAGPVVIRVVLSRIPRRVLRMDVRDMIAHVRPKLPRILTRPRLGLAAIWIEHGIRGVKDEFEAGTFV